MAYDPNTMSFNLPDTDTVYVSGLPPNTTEREVEEFFGAIGIIKDDKKRRGQKKIWLYRDKATGELKGDGTVSYDDPFSAASAVQWFNGKDWKGGWMRLRSRRGSPGVGCRGGAGCRG